MSLEESDALQRQREERAVLTEAFRLDSYRKLFRQYAKIYDPANPKIIGVYPWQEDFHNQGATWPTRVLMSANQIGKSRTSSAEVAIHATGEYPQWWKGKRFHDGVRIWTGATTNEKSRDVIQEALLGPVGQWGTGWIPASRIIGKPKMRQAGVSDVVDTIHVLHKSGIPSSICMKTFEQGRESWQGVSQNLIWLDEECPLDIYTEAMTRLVATNGIMIVTFTPLLGITELVHRFRTSDPAAKIFLKNVTWDDAPHLSKEKKDELIANYSEAERDTRARGIPLMSHGLIFPIDDDALFCDPFKIPEWFSRINGIDFGMDHPTAGAFCAHDRESDTWYVYDDYHMQGQTPVYHSVAMKKNGDWIPTAWPRDGLQRDKGSGQQLKDMYRQHGLYMLKEHAHYRDERGEHVEPGLIEMLEYMKSGKFKVFRTCQKFMEEKRSYHRDDKGQIVKIRDDVISAARYAFMMRRYARTRPSQGLAQNHAPGVPIIGRR